MVSRAARHPGFSYPFRPALSLSPCPAFPEPENAPSGSLNGPPYPLRPLWTKNRADVSPHASRIVRRAFFRFTRICSATIALMVRFLNFSCIPREVIFFMFSYLDFRTIRQMTCGCTREAIMEWPVAFRRPSQFIFAFIASLRDKFSLYRLCLKRSSSMKMSPYSKIHGQYLTLLLDYISVFSLPLRHLCK